ncbi:MAG: hypothetical protein GKR95_18455 [Gammaproteobacteria bacterium]|nr:hypothetical protein [Gammaproteobacteria bacterium]
MSVFHRFGNGGMTVPGVDGLKEHDEKKHALKKHGLTRCGLTRYGLKRYASDG